MASKKQKERKNKKRKEIAKARVLSRRKQLRDTMKKERQEQLMFETEYELKNGKQQPFVKNIDPEFEKRKNENIKKKLEHNMKLLEELEKEYLSEQQKREENLKDTEGLDLKDKIKKIAEKNLEENSETKVD